MINYRFYWLLPDGRIDTASNLEFADDGAARAQGIPDRSGKPRSGLKKTAWRESRLLKHATEREELRRSTLLGWILGSRAKTPRFPSP
jgi:hypothetical protein